MVGNHYITLSNTAKQCIDNIDAIVKADARHNTDKVGFCKSSIEAVTLQHIKTTSLTYVLVQRSKKHACSEDKHLYGLPSCIAH